MPPFFTTIWCCFPAFINTISIRIPSEPEIKKYTGCHYCRCRRTGIPCRITSLREHDKAVLEELYPGNFRFSVSRNNFDYVYALDDLADLKGRKYHRKRNHLKRFQAGKRPGG